MSISVSAKSATIAMIIVAVLLLLKGFWCVPQEEEQPDVETIVYALVVAFPDQIKLNEFRYFRLGPHEYREAVVQLEKNIASAPLTEANRII